ncbi:hypothetical protein BMF94_6479 [Rhodotorula taiwanensis]|uniref:Dynein light intermediate chain n=1 Tax=Rhodotorula taiwanensis TaxID=741276 RepID=A0A2S5B192_9BASI|nr:hypothetical protein BMF94_6479 [Rhodotorula taiwanensis]
MSPLAPRLAASTASAHASTSQGATLPGDGDLWSSILDSVKTSKAVQTKQCLVVGANRSGKSSLVARLQTVNGQLPPHLDSDDHDSYNGKGKALDLGMSYEVMDVRDDSDERDLLGRLGFYQIPTTEPPRTRLVSLALSRAALIDSLVVIVLDWQKPWTFIRELKYWIEVLEEALGEQSQTEGGEDPVEEGKRRDLDTVEATWRAYQEPTANGTMPSTSTASLHSLDAPLPTGALLENLGLNLVIVCTKADRMDMLERDREFSEDKFDYVQQLIRTVAMRYGAAVFYTSQTVPPSFTKLRQYILHRLFSAPSSAQSASASAAPGTPTVAAARSKATPTPRQSARASFPFLHRANVVDRDQVLVPTGWDTWGKIKVLKERFDCEACGQSWEAGRDARRRMREERAKGEARDDREEGGLLAEYESVVTDFDAQNRPNGLPKLLEAEKEQTFLRQHYEVLQAEIAKDPRLAFRQPGSMAQNGFGPSAVGPMAGSSFNLPTVATTLDRAREAAGASGRTGSSDDRYRTSMSRQNSNISQPARSPQLGSSTSPGIPSAATFLSRTSSQQSATSSSTMPTTPGSTTAGNAAGGNQVLADFFQSLLTARTAGATASTTGATASGGAAGAVRPGVRDA